MTSENDSSNIVLTITFTDPDLTAEELNEEAVRLLEDMEELRRTSSDIEAVYQVRDPKPPDGNKSFGGFLTGIVITEIFASGCRRVMHGFKDRLKKGKFSFEAKVNGVEMKVSANTQEDAKFALEKIEEFINKHKD